MDIVFIHRFMPGQFIHLARRLAADTDNRVCFVTRDPTGAVPGVRKFLYAPPPAAGRAPQELARPYADAVAHGEAVAEMLARLKREGLRPDLIVAHPGWGEALFVRDVWPQVPRIDYCEFYYHGSGADVGFDDEDGLPENAPWLARARNAHLLSSLESCDAGISPTRWQRGRHPVAYQSKISQIFDGIDLRIVRPDAEARFTLPNGRVLTREDEVVTYVARDLEPYRGFRTMMRAIPEICRRRPRAQIVLAGGDGVSYGRPAPGGRSWREAMCAEVSIDPARVHFVGRIPYGRYLSLLQVSSAHVYLTVPFVLSWSCVEALAAGCVVIGSATVPVREVIEHGRNGFLVDFFSPDALAETVGSALDARHGLQAVRRRAREAVAASFELGACLGRQLALLREVLAGAQGATARARFG